MKKPVKRQSANQINNITINGGKVRINLGRFSDDPNEPAVLDKRNDGFGLPSDEESDLTEDEPPGPDDMGGSTVYGNMCKASNAVSIRWVSMPHVAFKSDSIVFNHAAIRKFGMRQGMAIMICVTPDESAIRFFLGRERFPNNNAINKYGYYRLQVWSGGNRHKPKIDPRTGESWANPDWLTGRLLQRNSRSPAVGLQQGSRREFPLMAYYPGIIGCLGQVRLDRRFYQLTDSGEKAYNVLYVKMSDIQNVPTDLVDKTIGKFEDIVDSRLEWATADNDR